MNNSSEQTGLWIDKTVLFSDLKPLEKFILADVMALSRNENKFFKTNQSMAESYKVSLKTIKNSVRVLVERDLVRSLITYPYGNMKKKRILLPQYINIEKLIR